MRQDKGSPMEERLQREFGALARLESLESATVIARFRMCHHESGNDNVPNYKITEVTINDIGDRFANKLMDSCVERKEAA